MSDISLDEAKARIIEEGIWEKSLMVDKEGSNGKSSFNDWFSGLLVNTDD